MSEKKVDILLDKQTDHDTKMEILNNLSKEIDHDWFEQINTETTVTDVAAKQEPTPVAGIGDKTDDLEEKRTPKISQTNVAVNWKKDEISETSDEVNEKKDTLSELKPRSNSNKRKRILQAGNVFRTDNKIVRTPNNGKQTHGYYRSMCFVKR